MLYVSVIDIFVYICKCFFVILFFFFKQKTAYEMRISDWSSDVCSSDLVCGYIMMTMAVDVASRAGAHQPGFRRHVNTFTVAIALEQFDKATVNGRARVLFARPDKIAEDRKSVV